ncbi:hypothetical protein AB0H76_15400 [Nocardia sp. NPDC050712]|uniref:hypothetical protein n=1 Tax=Nocardia sp. NPDC050712 TaxID=3155518 RepID=UPI0033E8C6ED
MLAWLLITDAQNENGSALPVEPLWQYGAVGAIAAVCIYAVYRLFSSLEASRSAELERLQAAHASELERVQAAHVAALARADAAYDKEVARGDRMETGLRDLNSLVNNKLAGAMANATDAIREALEMTRDRRRP